MILFFCILLLIINIIMLVRLSKNKETFKTFLYSNLLSSILTIIFIIYIWKKLIEWKLIIYTAVGIISIVLSLIMLVISLVFKKKITIPENKKRIITNSIIIISLFIMCISLQSLKYSNDKNKAFKLENKAREQAITYLEKRYGDGNFKVKDIMLTNICDSCSWMSKGIDGYRITVSSSYLDEKFEIDIVKNDLTIYEDDFLSKYYANKEGINDLEDYLKKYKIDELNKELSKEYNAKIDFNNVFLNSYGKDNYGYIPSIEELSKYVELHDPKFEIKDFLSQDALLNYLIELTNYYVKEFSKDNILYSQTGKYFRYTNNDNSGYVLAGEYKYSQSEERYILGNEDTIIRIDINGKITTLNTENVLKD